MTGAKLPLDPGGVPALLRSLVRARRTGILRLYRARVVKAVHLNEGRIVFATSTDPDDRLGEMLLRKGLISFPALEESVKALHAGKRQGTILVERGDIRPKDLVAGVVEQIQEIVYGLFAWEDGEHEFAEGGLPREVIVLRTSTPDLLMEGARRTTRWGRIRAGVGSLDQRYRLAAESTDVVARMGLQREEMNLVAALDGEMTVQDLCGALPEADFLICRWLWGLWAAGVVDRAPQDVSGEVDDTPDKTDPLNLAEVRGASVGAEIDRFNELHRYVYDLVSYELREKASAFLEKAFVRVGLEHGPLFDGVAIDATGELDPIALRANVTRLEIAQYLKGLDRLLEIEVDLAREVLGDKKAAIVSDGLLALREHQLAARRY